MIASAARIAALSLGVLAWDACADTSEALLRSGARVGVAAVGPEGVTLTADGKPGKQVSLSEIRAVTGPLAQAFDANKPLATELWRAMTRLKRGDDAGAEAILARLWSSTKGGSGATRAEIAAGMTACLVHRGAFATAIEPWTEWIRSGSTPEGEGKSIVPVADSQGPWIAALPPVWIDSVAVRRLAERPLPAEDVAPNAGDDIERVYIVAARRDTGQPWQIDPAAALKKSSWASLPGEMVLAEAPDPAVRTEARAKLASRLTADSPLWKQCWIRLALGRSKLMESAPDEKRGGVAQLLWIASRPSANAAVTSLALLSAAEGLLALGDTEGAKAAMDDLSRRYSGAEILESPRASQIRQSLATVAAGAPQESK
ncbi:MAG: hypothetical protein U0570_14960 [Phycisphaerales bacterium]